MSQVAERKRARRRSGRPIRPLNSGFGRKRRNWAGLSEAARIEVRQRRKAGALKDELVSTVSHELRTPLSSLLEFSEIILDEEYPTGTRARA